MTSQRKSLLFLTIIILIFVGISFNQNNVIAAPNKNGDDKCLNLDIVFLIDESSSMSGVNSYGIDIGIPANDPETQRIYAVQWAIDWLSDNALDKCIDAHHRIAMISFGTEAYTTLELTSIDPDNLADWEAIRHQLQKNVVEMNLGQTNHQAALEIASTLWDGKTDPNGTRKKVIVLMTDGNPCFGEACVNGTFSPGEAAIDVYEVAKELFPFNEDLLKYETELRILKESYKGNVPSDKVVNLLDKLGLNELKMNKAYDESYYIWVMLMRQAVGSEDYNELVRDYYQKIAWEHGGEIINIPRGAQNIPIVFLDVMDELVGVKTERIECGYITVNPYLEKATITIFKNSSENSVVLSFYDYNGKKVEIEGGEGHSSIQEYRENGPNERYIFSQPEPGVWSISSNSCDKINATYEPIVFDLSTSELSFRKFDNQSYKIDFSELPEVDTSPFYNSGKEYYLMVELKDEEKNTRNNSLYSDFNIMIDLLITDANDNEKKYPMEWSSQSSAFLSKNPVETPIHGIYTVDVVGTTIYNNGEVTAESEVISKEFTDNLELFRIENVEFSVFPVEKFNFSIVSPKTTAEDKLNSVHKTLFDSLSENREGFYDLSVKPIEIKAQLLDSSNTALDLSIFDDPSDVLTGSVTITTKSGDEVSLNEEFKFKPTGNKGELLLIIPEIDYEGEYTVNVNFNNNSIYDEHYRPNIIRTATVQFQRFDGIFEKSITYQIITWLIVILIVSLIVRFFAVRKNRLTGYLVFESQTGKSIATYNLNRISGGKNYAKIIIKDKSNSLDLKTLKIKNIKVDKSKRSASSEFDEFNTFENETSYKPKRIKLIGKTVSSKSSIDYELLQGDVYSYSDESVAVMKYTLDTPSDEYSLSDDFNNESKAVSDNSSSYNNGYENDFDDF